SFSPNFAKYKRILSSISRLYLIMSSYFGER
ncbi:MAG: hypothetical protein ACI9G6_002255, partial [Limisphaerales bacterium]